MDHLSLQELKRLTRPHATQADEEDAHRYWSACSPRERIEAHGRLMREFLLWRGMDPDKPMDKTVRLGTLEEKNLQDEEWNTAFEQFLAER